MYFMTSFFSENDNNENVHAINNFKKINVLVIMNRTDFPESRVQIVV